MAERALLARQLVVVGVFQVARVVALVVVAGADAVPDVTAKFQHWSLSWVFVF